MSFILSSTCYFQLHICRQHSFRSTGICAIFIVNSTTEKYPQICRIILVANIYAIKDVPY